MKSATCETGSLLGSLLSLSPAKRATVLNSLSDREAEALFYDWPTWARPNQLPPEGDWSKWLLLAGRGFGKSRAGAEWVIRKARDRPGCRIAMVARTAADTRDVMVEGESGVLAISPPDFKPEYQPSKRRVLWPNGSQATLFSAEEPDALRGPQSHFAWCDELCLAAGTMVRTETGTTPIEDICTGDLVWTREGLRPVRFAGMTSPSAEVFDVETNTGHIIAGTANHPVYVEKKGFVPIGILERGDTLYVWDMYQRRSSGAGRSGIQNRGTTTTAVANSSTVRSMWRRSVISPKGITSTTKTATGSTTTYPTSKPFLRASMSRSTREGIVCGRPSSAGAFRPPRGRSGSPKRSSVHGVARRSSLPASARPTALSGVVSRIIGASVSSQSRRRADTSDPRSPVSYAAPCSMPTIPEHSAAREHVATCTVVAVHKRHVREPVYNLEVDGAPEYFANGILVHNCSWKYPETWDMLMFGLRLGQHPQVVITTTPRPVRLVKELVADPTCITVRGSTYENRANLAPSFFSQIVTKYEGTRLGRQELMAEILDDNPGAILTREILDDTRVVRMPHLTRIVVGVDPEATASETSAETGIVVAGLGVDGQGYIIDDATIKGSPAIWGAAVVSAYHRHRADRIVAEVNNGGDSIEYVIRSVDQNVSYRAVHASRGKQARAEPVSALFEQGRVHMVGTFAELEDQLVEWVPASGAPSPDRLDALVWAIYDLMLEQDDYQTLVYDDEPELISPV